MDIGKERRRGPRLQDRNSVAVTVLSCPAVRALEGQTLFCTTFDISANGLRVRTHRGIPPGAMLRALVAIVDPPRSYEHVCRVAWCGSESDRTCMVGIEFTGTDPEVLADWQAMVERRLADNAPEA